MTTEKAVEPGGDFTREVPEHSTLICLALLRPVKVFQMEHKKCGFYMCIAHFDHDGCHYLYQDGDGALGHGQFHYVLGWEDDRTAEQVALSFFSDKFILSPP